MSQATMDRILDEFAAINIKLDSIKAKMDALAAQPRPASAAPSGEVASDSDLDGQFGNPEIRKDPPRWKGESYAGQHYSAAPAEYLESLAGFLIWCADRDEQTGDADKIKYAGYKRRDAARARGWAKRKLEGKAPAPADSSDPQDALPF